MSVSKRPTEKRLSPAKLHFLSYSRNKWLGAIRQEILNSDIHTWDFRITIFFISLLIYWPIISVLTSLLPSIIAGNFFFFLFELFIIFILGIKTFGIIKRWAQAYEERERVVMAEQIQQDQHNGRSEGSATSLLSFDANHPLYPFQSWIRKNLYPYLFTTKEKSDHYALLICSMIFLVLMIYLIDYEVDIFFINVSLISYLFNMIIDIICILLIIVLLHRLREDWEREKAIMIELKRREQEEKLNQRFAAIQKQTVEIQDEAVNELLAFEDESPMQDDYGYPHRAWIGVPRDVVVRFSPKNRMWQRLISIALIFFILIILTSTDRINPNTNIRIISFNLNYLDTAIIIIFIISIIIGLISEVIIYKVEIFLKKDRDKEIAILESRTRKKEINVFRGREDQTPPPGFIKEHRYTDSIENLSLKGFTPSTISPDRSTKAIIDDAGAKILVKNAYTDKTLHMFSEHVGKVQCVAWSPNGNILASGAEDGYILLWGTQTGNLLPFFMYHFDAVTSLTFSPDGQILVSGSQDCTFRLWNPKTGDLIRTFEADTSTITTLSFSCDGRLLASMSSDGSVRFWRTDTWEQIFMLNEHPAFEKVTHIAFDTYLPRLATEFKSTYYIYTYIWQLDIEKILGLILPSSHSFISYVNAKVVLVGNSGVGKSGLGLVLSGDDFKPTDSTHGRHIWTLSRQEVKLDEEQMETHEILLWDLAGQPDYQLIHQLHLNEVTVALVVFDGRDARSSSDPFAGVSYWDHALQQAQRENSLHDLDFIKFLVIARTDVDSIGVGDEKIKAFADAQGFKAYFKTSAKERNGILELRQAILDAINWSHLPKITSTMLFQRIKGFLLQKKETGQLLHTIDELFHDFLEQNPTLEQIEQLREQFEVCIRQVESAGLIKRLSFARLLLLQPELLDAYASALVKVVKQAPDGLGSIAEAQVLKGEFSIPERIKGKSQELLLLSAMVEYLLDCDLALREEDFLIFPSQVTRESPDLLDTKGKEIIFDFEGAIPAIYATLAVRLARSGFFKLKRLWKNAITYTTNVGGTYGLLLRNIDNGRGNLTLFFGRDASQEARSYFEQFVQLHLQRKALMGSIKRRRLFICICGVLIPEEDISRQKGQKYIYCYACGTRIELNESEQSKPVMPSVEVAAMNHAADRQRQVEVETSSRTANQQLVEDKQARGEFDVFLCHRSLDKPAVKKIGEQLKAWGLLPWLDEWELRPGLPWQRSLENQIEHIKSAAVFVGASGIGPWQQQELEAFLREFVERGCPVIPVLLGDAPLEPQLPAFLRAMTWVDFRIHDANPMERLIWGITGKRNFQG